MSLEEALGILAAYALVGVLAVALGEPAPKHPILRGVRDIFNALEGRALPTPRNALIWWRRRKAAR